MNLLYSPFWLILYICVTTEIITWWEALLHLQVYDTYSQNSVADDVELTCFVKLALFTTAIQLSKKERRDIQHLDYLFSIFKLYHRFLCSFKKFSFLQIYRGSLTLRFLPLWQWKRNFSKTVSAQFCICSFRFSFYKRCPIESKWDIIFIMMTFKPSQGSHSLTGQRSIRFWKQKSGKHK